MLQITVKQDDVKDYLDWIKIIITICSAAVGSLAFKFDSGSAPTSILVATGLFVAALILFVKVFAGLVDHKSAAGPDLSRLTECVLLMAYICFLLGFGALFFGMF